MRFNRWLMFSLAVVALFAGAAQAQVSDSDFLSIVPVDVNIADNSLDTNFNVAVLVDHASTIAAISIPLEFPGSPGLNIDETVVTAGNAGVSYGPAGNDPAWTIRTSLVDNAGKGILMGFISFTQVNPTADTLVYVHFDRSGDGTSAVVPVDTGVVNGQRLGMTDIAAQEFKTQWSGATITIGAPEPTIGLSPTSLIFNSVLGTGNPPTQSVTITNVGAGSLSWTAITTQTWLAANPSSGTGNGATTVSVNTAGLTAGTYTGWVIITDPAASNSPESVFVALNLNAPTLSASPPALVFNGQVGGSNPSDQNFTLSASSGAAISWTGSNNQLWLDFIPTGGNTPNTVTASVDITGLGAGTLVDTIFITAANAANSPFPVPVVLNLTSPPLINLEPTSVNFTATVGGANPAPDTVALTNAGTGTLDYSTSTDQPWLLVTPGSGNAPANLVVSADITGLSPGTLTGNVIVTSVSAANSPETVTVSLTVQSNPPTFDVTPTGASFTATEGDVTPSPSSTPIFINNTGGGVLSWTVLGLDSVWVTLSKSAGGSPDTLVVSVDPVGLSAGVYQEVFQISDPSATNNPATITVDFEVFAGPPTIGVSPPSFTFNAIQGGANPANQTLSINSVGGSQALNWVAAPTQSWLALSDIAGTAPSTTDLMINITGLANGTYEDTITVTATGATNTPQTVPVTLIIGEPPPSIALDPDTMLFTATVGGPNPPAIPLGITNVGGGTLNWISDTDSPWLFVSDSVGIAPSTIQVSVDITGLTPATYTGEATVSSGSADNSPQIVQVTLVVNSLPAELQLTPSSLLYSAQEGAANPAAQSFKVENVGGGIMGWTASTSASWISDLSPASGSGDDDVFVSLDITGLTAGTYIDSVLVDAGSALNSPQWVLINLEVTPPPPPSIVLSPTSFTFTVLFGGGNPAAQLLDITNGGGRTLQWTATQGSSWLSLSDASGVAPSTVALDVDITGLAIGAYTDTVMVLSDSADNSPQMAIVQLDVVDNPPFMELSSTEFFFEMVIGDSDPPCQLLQIDNSGAGTLNWNASKNAAWLSLSSSSGVAPSSVDFCVNGTGLIPGTYRDTVVISSNQAINSPQEVIVTFVVKSVDKPSIVLQPDSLYFILNQGQESDPQCTYVWIDGNGGRLIWRAVTDASWISLSRDSCNISYPLCITVNSTGVEPGVYCDTVEISGDADNSPQYLTICMDVRSGGEQPILQVLNSEYFFTATEGDTGPSDPQTFMVNNTGSGILNWTAGTLAGWVSIDPTSGTAPSNGTYRVDPTGVSAGSYQATVEFDAPGALNSPAFVQVNLTVMAPQEEPVLAVNPTAIAKTVAVGSSAVTEALNIFNAGTGSLTWSLNTIDFAAWLSASDASGSAPGVSMITLDPAGLTAGVYVDTIVVTSPEAGNSPVGVPVSLTVIGGGQEFDNLVWLGSDTAMPGETVMLPVYFENDQPLFGVSVPLTWTGEGVWADSVSFSGSRVDGIDILAASVDTMLREVRIGVIPQTDPVPAGTGLLCNVWFTVSGASPNQTVMVDTMTTSTPAISLSYVDTNTTEFVPGFTEGQILVTGAQPPGLAVSPDSVHFEATAGGSNPALKSVTVLNTGGGSLTFSVSNNAPWLSLNPTSGSQGDSVFFQVDISGLSQDLYSGAATFVSSEAGDTVTVPVTLNVAAGVEPPVIALSPSEVNFNTTQGSIPPAVPITVLNTGGGSLNWTATKTQAWLGISPPTGSDGTEISVSITDNGLAPGLYVDTVTVTDPAATNSPQRAVVNLTVVGPATPDTIFVGNVSGNPGDTVEVPVRVKNSFTATAITLPFIYDGVGVDLVPFGALTTPRSGPAVFTIFAQDQIDTVNNTGLFGFLAFGAGMPAGDGDVLIMKFAIAPDAPPQTITIDTTFLPPANQLSMVNASAQEIYPDFVAGSITVLSVSGTNSIWISDAEGEPGEQVTVEVHAVNSDPIDRLLLPLQLTSMDMSIVGAEYLGTRSESGTPILQVVDDQHFTLDIDWSAQPLAAGSGPVARLIVQLDDFASPQTAYVDTAGDYGFTTSGGSQSVVVPQFTRGEVRLDVASGADDPLLPNAFALKPNYPNPFNPTTSMAYTLSESGHARLSIYNTLGRLVVTLVDQYQSAGEYDVLWNGRDLTGAQVPSGVYLYRLEAGTDVALRKMTLMK